MAVDVRVNVQMVLRVNHDGPTEGLDKAKYDALLLGLQINNPKLARNISETLEQMRLPDDTQIGWVDENVSFYLTDIPELTLMQIIEVVE